MSADVWLEGPEACFDRECDEYVDGEGHDVPEIAWRSHIREVQPPLGVLGEDRSEPTPAPREQWAVEHPDVNLCAHNSPHSVLYTLSKLPGGRIVVRDAPDQPWRPETRCLCGESKPADRHYIGCPDTSEVVTPEDPA